LSDRAGDASGLFRLHSEEDAFALLRRVLNGELGDETPWSIDFSHWPKLDIYLPETPLDASISPTMMEAFIELQTALYHVHSLLTTDSGDLRGLSKAEKETLEFRVRVSGGSSEYLAELSKPLETIGASVVSRMTPQDTFISVLVVALLIAGVISLKAWLKYKAQQRSEEVHKGEVKGLLDSQSRLMEHDERMQALLVQALKRQPVLEDVEAVLV
jgi:hypothetical protein